MNKRSIIICSVVAVVLLAGIGWLFCSLFFGDSGETANTDRLADGVEAVPSDAIFLFEAGSFSEISDITDEESALGRLAGCIPSVASGWEATLSMHYSSKNAVSPLLVLSIPETVDPSSVMEDILDECSGIIDKRYGQVTVHKSAVPDASFALCGGYLIASPSLVIVESSLRHLENGTSIKDEALYSGIKGVTSERGIIHVNPANLGKLFSGAIAREYLGKASFFQNFADWAAFGLEDGTGKVALDGRAVSVRQGERFSDVLLTQRGRKPRVYSIIPYDATYVLTVPVTDWNAYINAYKAYLAANGKKKDYDYLNVMAAKREDGIEMSTSGLASSLGIGEMAVFALPLEGERRILALNVKDASVLGDVGDSIVAYPYKGYLPALLGETFRPGSEDMCCVMDGWLLIGGKEELAYIRKDWKRGTLFTMQEYLEQTPASDELRKISVLSMMVNTGRCADSVAALFRDPYSGTVRRALGNRNFELLSMNMYDAGSHSLGIRAAFYAEDLQALPQPEHAVTEEIADDTPVPVPTGPFPVVNFIDGSDNWLEQLDDHRLRLLNRSRRPVWTVNFDGPLCGTVRQIDYLKNNKLQMLFGSGSKIYLLDRLGRIVRDFPIDLGKDILLGPDVYDFSGKKNYTLMVLHTDNTIVQYGMDGKRTGGWKDITCGERILGLPEMLKVGDNVCWVVRTAYQTLIYDSHGTICADFTKKHKLKKDTQIKPVSSHEVVVTTSEGREMVLDISDGSFRKRL